MKKSICVVLAALLLFTSTSCQSSAGSGALIGAGAGGTAGALIDRRRPWRGALIGAAAGAIIGYAIGNEIDKERERCARDAYRERRVIVREVEDQETQDRYRVRAEPLPQSPTQVTTTVSKYNPATGRWEVQSESTQMVN